MIIVRIKGGLGNQLFQYAFGLHLAKHLQQPLKLDIGFYAGQRAGIGAADLRTFDLPHFFSNLQIASQQEVDEIIKPPFLRPVYRRLAKYGIYIYPNYLFEQKEFQFQSIQHLISPNVYAEGYWQHWKYLPFVAKELHQTINLVVPQHLHHYLPAGVACIAVHVRRGDYVNHPVHPTLSVDYYIKAMQQLAAGIKGPYRFLLFSDDLSWCKANMGLDQLNAEVISVTKGNDLDQFRLMCACHHFIIANSTFSWWAAWFSLHETKKVIAPAQWINHPTFNVNDFYPDEWTIS